VHFFECTAIVILRLESLESIEEDGFIGCTNIKELFLPNLNNVEK
jgi:hypothetical protein